MKSLIDIGKKYPTSKNKFGFVELYDVFFKQYQNKNINILEIGVDNGDSLRLWREYFSKANICGIDIKKKNFDITGVEIMCGSQSDNSFLKSVVSKYQNFDIIIDDGSHISKDIISSFKYLFNHLNRDGIYIIEDLQTSYLRRYGGSRLNLNKKQTAMNFVKKLADSVNYEHNDRPFYKKNSYDGLIKSVQFFQNIVFIQKGESKKYYYPNKEKSTIVNYIKKFISLFY